MNTTQVSINRKVANKKLDSWGEEAQVHYRWTDVLGVLNVCSFTCVFISILFQITEQSVHLSRANKPKLMIQGHLRLEGRVRQIPNTRGRITQQPVQSAKPVRETCTHSFINHFRFSPANADEMVDNYQQNILGYLIHTSINLKCPQSKTLHVSVLLIQPDLNFPLPFYRSIYHFSPPVKFSCDCHGIH